MAWAWLWACVAGDPSPQPPAPAPPVAPTELPTPFTAAQLRDGVPLGTTWTFDITDAHDTTVRARWEVVAWSPEGCTIRTATGDEPPEELRATWEELRDHARFAPGTATLQSADATVPAGTFRGTRYTVDRGPGASGLPMQDRMVFVPDLPGPPVLMVSQEGASVTRRMVLVSRTTPPVDEAEAGPAGPG